MRNYEQKFVKFYKKFSFESGNAKERLISCGNDLEYAYSLSKTDALDPHIRNQWDTIWKDITSKAAYDENNSIRSSIDHSLHGKHGKSMVKFLIFFFEEYTRITKKSNYKD